MSSTAYTVVHDASLITRDSLAQTRQTARECALNSGLSEDSAGRFVAAVSEVASNTIRHADATGQIRILQDDATRLIAEILDHGPGIAQPQVTLPPPVATSGRGLWLAQAFADRVEIHAHRGGTVVNVEMNLHPRDQHRGTSGPPRHRDR